MDNKKFKVIEEGRLTSSEMKEVCGGHLCVGELFGGYLVTENCGKNLSGKYSTCTQLYRSCTETAFTQCNGYSGPTGPDGFIDGFVKEIF